jgi:hypothetical protein
MAAPRVLDAVVAGLGLGGSLALLGGLGPLLGVELYARSMMAGGIIFFAPGAPPGPGAFLVCSAGPEGTTQTSGGRGSHGSCSGSSRTDVGKTSDSSMY